LQWYRAQLLAKGEVVGTSAAVAALTGDNLVPLGSFDQPFAMGAAPTGWRSAQNSGGAEACHVARPGATDAPAIRAAPRHQTCKLESVEATPLDPHGIYVLTAWAFPDVEGKAAADPWVRLLTASGSVVLNFEDEYGAGLGEQAVECHQRGTAVFVQVVLPPGDLRPSPIEFHDLCWFDGSGPSDAVLLSAGTAKARCRLLVGKESVWSDLRVIGGVSAAQ
jgi:hypothetical protein